MLLDRGKGAPQCHKINKKRTVKKKQTRSGKTFFYFLLFLATYPPPPLTSLSVCHACHAHFWPYNAAPHFMAAEQAKQVIKRKLTGDSCKSQMCLELESPWFPPLPPSSHPLCFFFYLLCCNCCLFTPSRVRDFNNNKNRTQHIEQLTTKTKTKKKSFCTKCKLIFIAYYNDDCCCCCCCCG